MVRYQMNNNVISFWKKAYQEDDTITFSSEPNATITEFEHVVNS